LNRPTRREFGSAIRPWIRWPRQHLKKEAQPKRLSFSEVTDGTVLIERVEPVSLRSLHPKPASEYVSDPVFNLTTAEDDEL